MRLFPWRRAPKAVAKDVVADRAYDVLVKPIITEKSTRLSEHNQFAFWVASDATKPEIKAAVESIFRVKVEAVNTLVVKGKHKRFRGRMGQRSDRKKAIVSLAEGQSIDVTSAL